MLSLRGRTASGLVLLALLSGCAEIPDIAFVGNDSGSGGSMNTNPPINPSDSGSSDDGGPPSDAGAHDATVPTGDASGPIDAGSSTDASGSNPGEDAGDDDGGDGGGTTILCGSTLVANCGGCDAGILRCKSPKGDQCVSDCTQCSTGRYPCIHCPTAKATPRGVCVSVNTDGELNNCPATNLCACTTPSDCPAIEGAAQTCESSDGGKSRCLTCGAASTEGLACTSPDDGAGTCNVAAGMAPTCSAN